MKIATNTISVVSVVVVKVSIVAIRVENIAIAAIVVIRRPQPLSKPKPTIKIINFCSFTEIS